MLYTSPWSRFKLTTSVTIGTDCIGSCKSNYHTITPTTRLAELENDWNLAQWCRRFPYFVPLVFDFISHIESFRSNFFSFVEVYCRFINIHPCLGSILNVFYKYIINATTTAINTCKKCIWLWSKGSNFFLYINY